MAARAFSALVGAALLAAALVAASQHRADAEVTAVQGKAFGYYVDVGLFGGPAQRRGYGQAADGPAEGVSPQVTLPEPAGSGPTLSAMDSDGATGRYGPAVIFGGIWPQSSQTGAPPSGPITVRTQGTPGGGSVTSSVDIVLYDPPNADAPGGIGPGPLISDEAHSTCTATESGVTASATFVNGTLETKYDQSGNPIQTEPIPVHPPPNYTRSGTIDHVGDHWTTVFNEQVIGPDSITVNAAHMYLLGPTALGDMVVASSTCALGSTTPNTSPVAVGDTYSTRQGTPLTVSGPGILGNDSDPDGDPLTAVSPQARFVPGPNHPGSTSGDTYVFPGDPPNGAVALNPDGSFTYTPDAGFAGTDTFDYVVRDPRGAKATGTVTVNVIADQSPVAADDHYGAPIVRPLQVPAPGVLANDTDPEGDPLSAGSPSDPPNGSVSLNADGSFTYTPDPLFVGTDTFTYLLSDGLGQTDTGTVTIDVGSQPPVAVDDAYSTHQDIPLDVAVPGVLANDHDNDGDPMIAGSASAPAHGSVTLRPDGSFTYTPAAGFVGTDTFTYAASDIKDGSDTGAVTITVDAGPGLLKDLNSGAGASSPAHFARAGNTIYFLTFGNAATDGLWKTDGTAAGTVLVKLIGTGSSPLLASLGTTVFFAGDDGASGLELWKSDGTEAGTVLVKDITPGATGSYPKHLTRVGGAIYFFTNPGLGYLPALWRTDGTSAGTVRIKDIGGLHTVSGNQDTPLSVIGTTMFFAGVDETQNELWRSDGTTGGTVMVKDISPGSASSNPENFTVAGATLFFRATDVTHGTELWRSDGTEAGTTMVSDINPLPPNIAGSSYPDSLAAVGNNVFFAANDGIHGTELWRSDGTAAGTAMVKDVTPGPGTSSPPSQLTVAGSTVLFSATDTVHGRELWRSDGTEPGTALLKDINVGVADSIPANLTVVGGVAYFSANDGTHNVELWESDGTPAGTVLVKDIWPGSLGSFPRELTAIGSSLYFSAEDGVTGREPWQLGPVSRPAVADFDGNGTSEPSVYRSSAGTWYATSGTATGWGGPEDVAVAGDYDGDGKTDVAIFRPSTGLWAIHNSGGGPDSFVTYGGPPGDVPVPADYDGDGRADLAIYRPSTGTWFVHQSSDGADTAVTYGGIPGDVAVPTDYDGDGRADIAIFRAGAWYVHPSGARPDTAVGYGSAGDIPVPADYDGDGRADIAIFRPTTGLWAIQHSSGGAGTFVTYGGIAGDVPVPADYDGDGRADIAIFRPDVGGWYARSSATDTDTAVTFGIAGDTPVASPPAVRMAFFSPMSGPLVRQPESA